MGSGLVWAASRLLRRMDDERRIRGQLEPNGHALLRLARAANPAARRGERGYQVSYRTRQGQTIEATCAVSLLGGVRWTGASTPFELLDAQGEPLSTDARAAEEPTPCLTCGFTIPARQSRCPRCGWSYREA